MTFTFDKLVLRIVYAVILKNKLTFTQIDELPILKTFENQFEISLKTVNIHIITYVT